MYGPACETGSRDSGRGAFCLALKRKVATMLSRRDLGLTAAAGVGVTMAASAGSTLAAEPKSSVSFNVIYPNHDGARFDTSYYLATHIPMVMRVMKADKVTLIEGAPRGATPPPFVMIAHFEFASSEALETALAKPEMAELRADVAKFTNIKPTTMFGKPL
jgi:uncharacterized protein (TIGR02118 family)